MREFSVPQGMPSAVFHNKYSRRLWAHPETGELVDTVTLQDWAKSNKVDLDPDAKPVRHQTWVERVTSVVAGNLSLSPGTTSDEDNQILLDLAVSGVMPFSGRHLQHGDDQQRYKLGETFTNCSTSMTSFVKFWLLLKGSGVGRCYDGDICRVNWDYLPHTRFVLSSTHPNYEPWVESLEDARQKYPSESEDVRWFTVKDSAEGWVKVVEILETASYQQKHRDKIFIFDLTPVREAGAPIRGQQGRPASGPIPLIRALLNVMTVRGAGMQPWKQAMYIDHYLSEAVQLGGVRRSARIACKSWRDRDIFDFIDIKRGGFLWSANNSVLVDAEFWEQAAHPRPSHGRRVYDAIQSAAYFDRTGEPAFINQHLMSWSDEGVDEITAQNLLTESPLDDKKLTLHRRTYEMLDNLLVYAKAKKYPFVVNPCGEIILAVWGGYCVIGDICLANAETLQEALDAARLMGPFLMRTNTMPFLYQAEVKRTNRIGIGLTGIFEFAFNYFGLTFFDLMDEDAGKEFWDFIALMRHVAHESIEAYAKDLGVKVPHTALTVKPSGTVSKCCACTEGAHLPAYAYYLRWVQYEQGDPEIADLEARGYPTRHLSQMYAGKTIVGFPTALPIAQLMGDKVVTMTDVTPEHQYRWLQLLEKYWLGPGQNNQVSYTLKFDPERVSFEEFKKRTLDYQGTVRCCSVMPQVDTSAYEYTPEQRITKEEYEGMIAKIDRLERESYDKERLDCEGGACPVELDIN